MTDIEMMKCDCCGWHGSASEAYKASNLDDRLNYGDLYGEPQFDYMEATDEMFEAVYGYKPEWEYEASDVGGPALVAD